MYDDDRFGSGEGDLYLENVQCDGSENRLEDCHVSGEQCSHSDAVGVSCQGIMVIDHLHAHNASLSQSRWRKVKSHVPMFASS